MVAAPEPQPSLDAVVREIGELRPLPALASAVLRITDGDHFSAQQLSKAISTDLALTAKVLRLANSAYYGFPRRIGTVRDAVVLIGFRAVRSAVLSSCVIDAVGASRSFDYRAFWRYSVTVGTLAEIVARAEGGRAEEAFTAGVLHNIGRLALDQHLPHLAAHVRHESLQTGRSLHETQRRGLGYTDADLGGALALHWNFPEELADAVRHHPLNVYAMPDEEGSLTAFVVRARRYARAYGLSDGVETSRAGPLPAEWAEPPLSVALRQAGGMEGVQQRVDSFLESMLVR